MKPWQGHAIIALLAFIFALQLRDVVRGASWEYKVESIRDDGWKQADFLGGQGWEAASCRRALTADRPLGGESEGVTECIFKRRR
jgi:hypothetical protein